MQLKTVGGAKKLQRRSVLQQGGSKILRGSGSQMDIPTAADFEGLIPGLRQVRQKIRDYMDERAKQREPYSPGGVMRKVASEAHLQHAQTQWGRARIPDSIPDQEAGSRVSGHLWSYKTPFGDQSRTPQQKSSKLIELQESIKQMLASGKKDSSLRSKLPQKVPNAQGIGELLDRMDYLLGRLDKRVVGEASHQREKYLEKHLGNMVTFQKSISGLRQKTDPLRNQEKLGEEIDLLKQELEFFKSDCTQIDNECYDVGKRLQQLKSSNLELQHESGFYADQLEYAEKNQLNLQREITKIEGKLAQVGAEKPVEISLSPSPVKGVEEDYFQEVVRQFQNRINKCESRLLREKREASVKQRADQSIQVATHPLQSHFETCLLRVKQKILERKYPSKFAELIAQHERGGAEGEIMRSHVETIQSVKFGEFMASDKRDVLELFLKDEEVRWFVYQSLFGHENELMQPERSKYFNIK